MKLSMYIIIIHKIHKSYDVIESKKLKAHCKIHNESKNIYMYYILMQNDCN